VKRSNRGSVLTTIVDVMKMHSSEQDGGVKDMSCERYQDWRMRLPSKRCVNLPLSFFKQIVMKDGEQSQRNFWSERWSWNSVWIPLVLVSSASSSPSLHTLATRDWYSQDICVRCQEDLLQACDSRPSRCPVTDSQEI
ncbi:hypothetical protein cypCar_00045501, partial [Cyprinus carpio]